MLKRKYCILGVLAILCFIGTGYYAWTLYDVHQKQVAEWNEEAKAAFEEALWMEVNKRAEVPIFSYSSEEKGMTTLNEKIPDSVFVTSAFGRKGYRVERCKYDNSLIKEAKKRVLLSTLLKKYPLAIDSLAIQWNLILKDKKVFSQNQIRYVYTDLELQTDTAFSNNSFKVSETDSLTVKYLGFRCEHELVGYVSYPFRLFSLSLVDLGWLILPWGLFILSAIFYVSIEKLLRCKFVEEKIVEKEIHVADVSIDKAKIYQLPDGSVFDSFAGTLTKDDLIHTLPPQSALLLRLFLRNEKHRLTTMEIEQELWNGQGSVDKIHKVIQRLRNELKKVSSDLVIKNVNGDYELK